MWHPPSAHLILYNSDFYVVLGRGVTAGDGSVVGDGTSTVHQTQTGVVKQNWWIKASAFSHF